MTKTDIERAIEDLIDRFGKLPTAEYLDALDEMALRADTAATAHREDLERENDETIEE